jgi:heme exporter protein A
MSLAGVAISPSAAVPITIVADELGHRYAPGRGLDPVSFSISGPGVAVVTGPNGAGKSTLLRALAGLLHANRGRCRVESAGRALTADERRGRVGFAAPDLAFYDELTVAENLRFVTESRGTGSNGWREPLAHVGLAERGEDFVGALSSGLKQRLRLAFALLGGPALLLLDEPSSHLDDTGRALVRDLLDRHRQRGLAVMATNDEREWSLADWRIELRGRRLGDRP